MDFSAEGAVDCEEETPEVGGVSKEQSVQVRERMEERTDEE